MNALRYRNSRLASFVSLLGILFVLHLSLFVTVLGQIPGPTDNRILLPNGWWLSPYGEQLMLHDFPVNATLTSDERLVAVLHAGYSKPLVYLIDTKTRLLKQRFELKDAWYGIRFSRTNLYISGGNQNCVYTFALVNDTLAARDTIRLSTPRKKFLAAVAGLDVLGSTLAVVTRNDSSLHYIDLKTKSERTTRLDGMPYACTFLPDGRLLVSIWDKKKIAVFKGAERRGEIPTGDHPNEISLSRDGKHAFVSNANDNTVTVIDLKTVKAAATIVTSLYPESPEGSTTNSAAPTSDGKSLLVANADNNAVTVVDIRKPTRPVPVGFIPVGWYPTKVLVLKNNTVLVLNGKGDRSPANPHHEYIGGLLKGTMSIFRFPDARNLADLTKQVYANTPYQPFQMKGTNSAAKCAIPSKVGDASPIKHIFYIIKENRTYDQVFGDMREGNGDSLLCIFGENITPNHHKLAREFVLFDNLYVNSEVSADGHNWSDAAYATDFVEKTWPGQYAGRGGAYDFDGVAPASRPAAGYLWDHCKKFGVTYRSYGEFVENGKGPGEPNATWEPSLKGHIAPFYRGWDLSYSDLDREKAWEKELDEYERTGGLPQFNVLVLPNDHTAGTGRNNLTPQAYVAQNDYALGLFVERLSKSAYWKESALFVIEDDAQNGPDHVDAHRSVGLVISPYTKRKFVDHTLYTTASMLRTMELVLGLPPMSQYDASSPPMFTAFTSTPDTARFTAEQPRYDITRKNKEGSYGQRLIEKMNFTTMDAVPDRLFNEIIWHSIKGTPMPAPKYSILSGAPHKEGDDE